MFRNYLTSAIRNLFKRKLYSFINIAGLATGVAVCLIILNYVDFELSYDRFNAKADRIYRVTNSFYRSGEFRGRSPLSGYALGPSLLNDIPEVKTYVRTHPMYGGSVITYDNGSGAPQLFHEENVQFVDSTFFKVFTYKAVKGNLETALNRPTSLVITEEMAKKYFGSEDPVGKTLKISGGWSDGDYEVTAVIKNVPENSHFQFDFVVSIHNLLENGQYTHDNGWGWYNFITYVELNPNVDVAELESKMPAFVDKYMGKDLAQSNSKQVLEFQPIVDIHLEPGLENEMSDTMSISTIYFFLVIAVFIMAIAWVNYINLSTSRAVERAREVGIKKAVGAYRGQLISQFFFESVLVNGFSVVIAMILAMLLLPVLNEIIGKSLAFNFTDYRLWLLLMGLFLGGSLASGIYPAIVLSSFNTIETLRGKASHFSRGISLREVLVVFQFTASLVLIAGTFAVYRQIIFMQRQDKGLQMEQTLIFDGPSVFEGSGLRDRLITFKHQISEVPNVRGVATSGAIPGGGYNWGTHVWKEGQDREQGQNTSIVWVDPDFVSSYEFTLLAGKNFDPTIRSSMESVIINETSLTTFGLGDAEQALNERLVIGGDTANIVGVLKNYHWNSLKVDHSPWIFKADTIARRNFSVHLSGNDIPGTVKKIESMYKEAFPGNPFDYRFLDDFFNGQYKDDQQFARVFGLFAMLAIFIACLGLWGLASFNTTLRLKEIGIRKVMGASVNSIVTLLSWQFLKLVLISSVVALPLSWYGIDKWLQTFAFHIGLRWELFVVPIVVLLLLAQGTVLFQILRGTSVNPAKILRSE